MDMILTGFTSLYVLFYKESSKEAVSATNELSRYKGPSLPKERKIGQSRYSAESAQVSVLTYIHVSDEPSDIIREIGAFFDRERV